MTEREQSRLQFSIEESVWLKKGQEVNELLTVALDPDVTVEETEEQVMIKGSLCLTGEYRTGETPSEKSGDEKKDNQLSYRSFAELSEISDETVRLEHRFPVDITLPVERIENVDELYVNVDNFDYELPSPSCLEVTASISVSGVYDSSSSGRTEDNSYEVDEDEESFTNESTSNPFPILEFESRRNPEPSTENTEISMEFQTGNREPQIGFSSRSEPIDDESTDYTSPFTRDVNPSGNQWQYTYDSEEEASVNQYDNDYEEEETQKSYQENDEEIVEEQPQVEAKYQKPPREENALYLTKMLTRDEEALTKLKMCIIQAGDSLDTIAGKYDVPTSQLMRVNRLESEEIEEGQILYIPVSASR